MSNHRAFIKEIFENWGYIEIEACSPDDLKEYLKDHFITMIPTDKILGACGVFRFTGTYSMIKKMYKENWDESAYDKEIRVMFQRIK